MNNEDFDNYMLEFKTKSLKEKQRIVIEQTKILTVLANEMCHNLDINNKLLLNREVQDVNKENYTEDDFAEAMLVYINSIQDSLCDFAENIDIVLSNMGKR